MTRFISAFSFLIFFFIFTAAAAPTVMPGCEDQARCGEVAIPFPFGTRPGCYLNADFYIRCVNSSKAMVGNTSQGIKEISLDGNLVALYDMVYDCRTNQRRYRSDAGNRVGPLPGTFFYNNSANVLTIIGCDATANVSITKGIYTSVDVEGSEFRHKNVILSTSCNNTREVKDDSCLGFRSDQKAIPNGAWHIFIRFNNNTSHNVYPEFSPCTYGFLVQRSTFQFSADNLTNIHKHSRFSVLLDWVVENGVNCQMARKKHTTDIFSQAYACIAQNSTCYDQVGAFGYRCRCQDGFQGNPLSLNGCTDIDECSNSSFYHCPKQSTYVNEEGGYICKCNQGFSKTDNSLTGDCIADNSLTGNRIAHHQHWPILAVITVAGIAAILIASICLFFRVLKIRSDFRRLHR